MPVRDLSRIHPFGPKSEYVNVIIETPRGSHCKFKYDEEHGMFMFDKVLPIGLSFPYDFGFLPSTRGGDGDPLDVLVLTDQPTFVGCLVRAKLLGVLEAEQQTEEGETERNDRFIAVPIEAKSGQPAAGSIARLEPALAQAITDYFVAYNALQGKKFEVLRRLGPEPAARSIRAGMSKSAKRSRKR